MEKKSIEEIKEEILDALEDKKDGGVLKKCSVCGSSWKSYDGDYDLLCNKHYLEIEPTN